MGSKESSLRAYWRYKFDRNLPLPMPVAEQVRRYNILTGEISQVLYEDDQIPHSYWDLFELWGVMVFGSFGRVPDPEFGPHEELEGMTMDYRKNTDIDLSLVGGKHEVPAGVIIQFADRLQEPLIASGLNHRVKPQFTILTPYLLKIAHGESYWQMRHGFRIISRKKELLGMFDPSVCVS